MCTSTLKPVTLGMLSHPGTAKSPGLAQGSVSADGETWGTHLSRPGFTFTRNRPYTGRWSDVLIPGQEEYFKGLISPFWRLLYKTRSFRREGEAGAEVEYSSAAGQGPLGPLGPTQEAPHCLASL